jgi:hypothetical protein
MAQYQIYRLSGAGAVVGASFVECATDEEACQRARCMAAPTGKAEVWLGIQCVGRVSAMAEPEFPPPAGTERLAPLGHAPH